MTSADWEVELSDAAEADLREIVRWTTRQFGAAQAMPTANFSGMH